MIVQNQTDLKLANKRYGQTPTRFGWAGRNDEYAQYSSRLNGLNVTNQDGIRKSFYLG